MRARTLSLRIFAMLSGAIALCAAESIWLALGIWFVVEPIAVALEYRRAT